MLRAENARVRGDYVVRPKKYLEQRLRVAPGQVELSPADQARYESEREHQLEVMATLSGNSSAAVTFTIAGLNVEIQRAPQAIRWNDPLCRRVPLLSSHSQQSLRICAGDGEQRARCATRLLAALLPALEGADGHPKQRSKLRLR